MKYNAFIDCEGSLAFELRFLAKATEKCSRYLYHENIFITPSESGIEGQLRGMATDGKRLHIVDPLDKSVMAYEMTQGFWRILKETRKPVVWAARLADTSADHINFPDIKRVMPNGEPEYETEFSGFSHSLTRHNYGQLAKFLHEFPDATAINLDYLHDLGTDFNWKVEWYGSQKALKFTELNRTAIIMPMYI